MLCPPPHTSQKKETAWKPQRTFKKYSPFAALLSTVRNQPSWHICYLTVTEYFFSLQTHTTGRVSKRTPPSTALLVPSSHYSAHLQLASTLLSIYLLSICFIYDTGWGGGCYMGGSRGHRYPNNALHYLPDQTFGRHLHAICSITHVQLWKQVWHLFHLLQHTCMSGHGVCRCHRQISKWRC